MFSNNNQNHDCLTVELCEAFAEVSEYCIERAAYIGAQCESGQPARAYANMRSSMVDVLYQSITQGAPGLLHWSEAVWLLRTITLGSFQDRDVLYAMDDFAELLRRERRLPAGWDTLSSWIEVSLDNIKGNNALVERFEASLRVLLLIVCSRVSLPSGRKYSIPLPYSAWTFLFRRTNLTSVVKKMRAIEDAREVE